MSSTNVLASPAPSAATDYAAAVYVSRRGPKDNLDDVKRIVEASAQQPQQFASSVPASPPIPQQPNTMLQQITPGYSHPARWTDPSSNTPQTQPAACVVPSSAPLEYQQQQPPVVVQFAQPPTYSYGAPYAQQYSPQPYVYVQPPHVQCVQSAPSMPHCTPYAPAPQYNGCDSQAYNTQPYGYGGYPQHPPQAYPAYNYAYPAPAPTACCEPTPAYSAPVAPVAKQSVTQHNPYCIQVLDVSSDSASVETAPTTPATATSTGSFTTVSSFTSTTTASTAGTDSMDETDSQPDDKKKRRRKRRKAKEDNQAVDAFRYKTKICKNWETNNKCPYGPRCLFAHGKRELRTPLTNQQIVDEACRSPVPIEAFLTLGKYPSFIPVPDCVTAAQQLSSRTHSVVEAQWTEGIQA